MHQFAVWRSGESATGRVADAEDLRDDAARVNDLLVDRIADVALALQRNHVPEARARGDGDWRVRATGVLVAAVSQL